MTEQKTLSVKVELKTNQEDAKKAASEAKKVIASLKDVEDALTDIEDGLDKVADNKGLEKAAGAAKKLEEELEKVKATISDPNKLAEIEGRIGKLKTSLAGVQQKIIAAEAEQKRKQRLEQISQRREKFDKLGEIGGGLAASGGGILAAMTLSANNYVQNAGRADEVSRKWLNTTDKLGVANMRIGRTMATALLPVMEKAADLAGKVADFIEANPAIVQGVAAAAGMATALGTVAVTLGTIGKFVTGIQALGTLLGVGGGAATATAAGGAAVAGGTAAAGTAVAGGTATAGGVAAGGLALAGGSVLAGVGLGFAINDVLAGDWDKWLSDMTGWKVNFTGLNQSIADNSSGVVDALSNLPGVVGMLARANKELGGGKLQWNPDVFSQGVVVAGAGLDFLAGKLGLAEEGSKRWATSAAQAMGYLETSADGATAAITGTASALRNSPKMGAAVDAFIAFTAANEQAEAAHQKQVAAIKTAGNEAMAQFTTDSEAQRTDIVNTFGEQRVAAEQDFAEQQAANAERGRKEDLKADAAFAKQQGKAAAAFAKSEAKATTDHQKALQELLEGGIEEGKQAEADYYAQRSKIIADAGEEDKQAEEEHQTAMRRMAEDSNRRLVDFARARDAIGYLREKREAEIARQRAEEDFNKQQVDRSAEISKQIGELEAGFAEEKAARDKAKEEAITSLITNFEEQKIARQEAFAEQQAEAAANYAEQKAERIAQRAEAEKEAAAQFAKQQAKELEAHTKQLEQLDAQNAATAEKMQAQTDKQVSDLEAQYLEETEARKVAFADQLRELDYALLGEEAARDEHYDRMAKGLEAWLGEMEGKVQSKIGGYNPNSPENMGAAAGGNSTSKAVNINNNVNNSNNFGAGQGDITAVASAVKQAINDALYTYGTATAS